MSEVEHTYYVEMRKTIVVPINATSVKEALTLAAEDDSGFDGAWDRTEPETAVIGVDDEEVDQ